MQIVTLYGTMSPAASGKSLYRVEMSVGSFSYARDLLRVARENPLVSYPILDPWVYLYGRGFNQRSCDSRSGSIPLEAFADCFRKLYERCRTCVVADGDYF